MEGVLLRPRYSFFSTDVEVKVTIAPLWRLDVTSMQPSATKPQ